jgi:DnaJ-class molecular chaperone
MTPETDQQSPDSCRKCDGTGEMDPFERVRVIFGDHKFVCDRCAGTKTELPPR